MNKDKVKILAKQILLWLVVIILLPLTIYIIIALISSAITVNNQLLPTNAPHRIYLHTNGIHLDITLNTQDLSPNLLKDLQIHNNSQYISFGKGDKNFYLNTPTLSDLTITNTVNALFLPSNSVIHVNQHITKEQNWTTVNITDKQLTQLNQYINNSFTHTINNHKILIANKGYTDSDNFYQANGNYSLLNTCNTWVNTAFKNNGLPASMWTPFDFGVLNKYK